MKYNLEELRILIKEAVESSKSMAEAGTKVGINFKTFKKYAKEFGLFVPNQKCVGIKKKSKGQLPLEDVFNGLYPKYTKSRLRIRLINEGYKEHKCEMCLLSKWLSGKIPLELHHKDGNSENHSFNNLEILCPNCHSLTDTYGSKNISDEVKEKRKTLKEEKEKNKEKYFCNICSKNITKNKTGLCQECYSKSQQKQRKILNRPSLEQLLKDTKELGFLGTGRKYEVSDNSIRKWIKSYQKDLTDET